MSISPSIQVHGISLTPLTQCTHYHSALDILAIQHYCCRKFYACISCHNALESHASAVWPKDQRHAEAAYCGACKGVMSIEEYMGSDSQCAKCGARMNPGCKGHWGLYFEVDESETTTGRK